MAFDPRINLPILRDRHFVRDDTCFVVRTMKSLPTHTVTERNLPVRNHQQSAIRKQMEAGRSRTQSQRFRSKHHKRRHSTFNQMAISCRDGASMSQNRSAHHQTDERSQPDRTGY